MKVKEWCIALDNISPYIDPVLGLRYKFFRGERATKEEVFNMIPDMTEEEYARCFRPATEEEINGEFEWDGEQYVLVKEKDTSGLTELEKAISKAIIGYMFLPQDLDHCVNKHIANNYYRKCAQEILSIARKQIAEEIDVNNIKGLDFDAVIRAHTIGRYFEARPFALECYHKGIEDVLEQVKKG